MVKINVYDTLCEKIGKNELFLNAYSKIIRYNYTKNDTDKITREEIQKLLETAGIFSCSSDIKYMDVAYKIITLLSENFSKDYDGINSIVQYLLIRMKQFLSVRKNVNESQDFFSMYTDDTSKFNPLLFADILLKKEIFRSSSKVEMGYFTEFQKEAYDLLSKKKRLTLVAPTSAGKSYIFTQYLTEVFNKNSESTIIYVVPSRALISQVQRDFHQEFAKNNIKDINIMTSSLFAKNLEFNNVFLKNLFILTQERLKNLLFKTPFSKKIDLLIIDEAQTISNKSRGILLEEVIEEILRRNPDTQTVFIIPRAINPKKFGEMFRITDLIPVSTKKSPVSQNLVFVNIIDGKYQVILNNPQLLEEVKLLEGTLENELLSSEEKKAWFVNKFQGDSDIIYCNSPNECITSAFDYINKIKTPDYTQEELKELRDAIWFLGKYIHKEFYLINLLSKGAGFHFGKLPSIVRNTVEDLFRKNIIKKLYTTSTLLEGVNLPAKNIFLYKPSRGGKGSKGLDEINFWNLAGRAGRAIEDYSGNIYCLNVFEWLDYKPKSEDFSHEIESAMESTIIKYNPDLIKYLQNHLYQLKGEPIEQVVTRFIIQEIKRGDNSFIKELKSRNIKLDKINFEEINSLVKEIANQIKNSPIKSEIIEANSHIDPRKLLQLYNDMKNDNSLVIIPSHPYQAGFSKSLERIYEIIWERFLQQKKPTPKHMAFLSQLWVKEVQMSDIIENQLNLFKVSTKKDINNIIKNTFSNIEEYLRFKCKIHLEAYIDILTIILEEENIPITKIREELPNYLEMGACTKNTLMLETIGLSRLSAITVSNIVPRDFNDILECKSWLKKVFTDKSKHNEIPNIILKEIQNVF